MKIREFHYRPVKIDLNFAVDVAVAVAVAVVFSFFAETVMQIDSNIGSHMVFPPGRTVFM